MAQTRQTCDRWLENKERNTIKYYLRQGKLLDTEGTVLTPVIFKATLETKSKHLEQETRS